MQVGRRPAVQDKVGLFNNGDSGPGVFSDVCNRVGKDLNPEKIGGEAIRAHPSFIEYLSGNYYDRVMKVLVRDGYFWLAYCLGREKDWEEDYDNMVLELLDEDESCFLIYRLDEPRGSHFEHVLITWQPDESTVQDRAAYTMSKPHLPELFEDGIFTYNLTGQNYSDIDFNALKYIMMGEGEIEPLSRYEELKKEALAEEEVERNRALKKIPDMDMHIEDDAVKEIGKFVKGFINFIQFAIDGKKETIRVTDSSNIKVDGLAGKMPEGVPRFNLYRYSHVKDGNSTQFIPVFLYYVPEEGTAKAKSLYPCAIDCFIKRLQNLNADIKLRLEFSDMDDMTEGVLYEMIYPPDRATLLASFKEIKPAKRAGKRGGWVKVLPV